MFTAIFYKLWFRIWIRHSNLSFAECKPEKKQATHVSGGQHRFDSFGLKEYGNGFKMDGRRLKLSGMGEIACALASSDCR